MEKGKIHLIGNSHIDAVWFWSYHEGYSEVLATFQSALDRMNEDKDVTFTAAGAMYYQWVEETDPKMFAEIQKRVEEGRWEIAGGMMIQPDCNLPSGESFMRQLYYSQRYYQEKFHRICTTGYNVDSFGHNASLPKILSSAGIKHYVFMRPDKNETDLPFDLFIWKSKDGSEVTTSRINYYCINRAYFQPLLDIDEEIKKDQLSRMAFIGIGNHGGGVTAALLDKVNEWKKDKDYVFWSTTDQYFNDVEKRPLPTYEGELQHHSRGCYSANLRMKQLNRRAENDLLAAESYCLLAKRLCGKRIPQEELDRGYRNLLFNQFHDLLAGTAIRPSYETAFEQMQESLSIAERVSHQSMQAIARTIDTGNKRSGVVYKDEHHVYVWQSEKLGTPVIVFNPLPFPVKRIIQILPIGKRMTDEEGKEILCQKVRGYQTNGADDHYNTIFEADLPAFGYRTYRFFLEGEEKKNPSLSVDETHLENEKLKVEFDETTGEIKSIYNKEKKTYLLKKPAMSILLDETECDTWAHRKFDLGKEIGSFGNPEIEVLEEGPLRVKLRVKQSYEKSTLIRDYSLVSGSSVLQVEAMLDFHEHHKVLKIALPTEGKDVTSAIPFGTLTRPLGTGEESMQAFYHSGNLLVCNDSFYGYDSKEGYVRMTVVRGCGYADHYGVRDDQMEFMDQGELRFSYTFSWFEDDASAYRLAKVLNTKMDVLLDSFHEGERKEKDGFLTYSGNGVITALKTSKEGKALVRVFEANGKEEQEEVNLFGKTIQIPLAPYAIKTVDEENESLNAMEWKEKGNGI